MVAAPDDVQVDLVPVAGDRPVDGDRVVAVLGHVHGQGPDHGDGGGPAALGQEDGLGPIGQPPRSEVDRVVARGAEDGHRVAALRGAGADGHRLRQPAGQEQIQRVILIAGRDLEGSDAAGRRQDFLGGIHDEPVAGRLDRDRGRFPEADVIDSAGLDDIDRELIDLAVRRRVRERSRGEIQGGGSETDLQEHVAPDLPRAESPSMPGASETVAWSPRPRLFRNPGFVPRTWSTSPSGCDFGMDDPRPCLATSPSRNYPTFFKPPICSPSTPTEPANRLRFAGNMRGRPRGHPARPPVTRK